MSTSKHGGSTIDSCNLSIRFRNKPISRGVAQCMKLLLVFLFSASLWGQQQNSLDGTQNSTTPDCADPLQASSSQCSAQNQQGAYPLNLPPQSRSAQMGDSGSQARSQTSDYSDTERLSRQNTPRQQGIFPPEPLTEFQKFIASTTRQILPIFGASLFQQTPSTFAPLDLTPVPANYILGPGDELRIRIWGQVNFQANLRIDRSGEIYLPQVGPVHVAGLAFSAIDAHLRSAIGRVYKNFDLTVDAGQIRAIQVYVSGEARRPGVYTVSSLSTLVNALFASGGPSIHGSMRHIQLRRGDKVVTDFDLYDLLIRGDKSKDAALQSGDVIFIPPTGGEVAVTGSVSSPAIYELRGRDSLADLVSDAGGVSAVASHARISIERIEDHQDRTAVEVEYNSSGLATPMKDGDLVRVFSIVPMYQKTVILRGNTANPGRFAWHAGMRVSDLIPDKDSLITRNYWWKRAQLGLPAPEFEPSQDFAIMHQPTGNNPVTLPAINAARTNQSRSYETRSGQTEIQQDQTQSQLNEYGLGQYQNAPQRDQSGSQQNPFPDQQDVNGAQRSNGLSSDQMANNSSLAAQQGSGQFRNEPLGQRTEVRQIAPEIDWDYAVIERLDPATLKNVLIPFDLGKLVLQHDPSEDRELQAGDVVSVFSAADIRIPVAHQTKLVTLGGEFKHAGVYTVLPGETFRQLVERAGGLTPDAYLYGSEYTRESTRELQQARINEYVQRLGMEIQRSTLSLASSAVSSPQDLASAAAAQSNEKELLASLRQVRATGRIVLKFTPESQGTETLPEIALEDGDRFFVPSVPATVNVVGAVYNQNSFLYARQQAAGTYLRLAGGPNRDADWKREFVIRADGEVVSHDIGKGLWSGKFDSLCMYPGDSIVVPEKIFKPSALRGVLEFSQLFSQLALGAAALTIIQ
jgi:protein involved in polysaccharide export with SLBB domain